MIRVLSIFGTRPETIKLAPLLRELERREGFRPLVCVTGQHRELLQEALRVFDIRPDYDLALPSEGKSPLAYTAAALPALEGVLREADPALVLVHGDTVTTLAGALAAAFARVPLGHVEAGLRSGDMALPFPEELDRRLVDALSLLHFAPTQEARRNLLREGAAPGGIFVTGNTGVDALSLTVRPDFRHPALDWARERGRFVLLTAHRRESWGAPMRGMFRGVLRAAERFDDVRVLCPLHPNPLVRAAAEGLGDAGGRLRFLKALDVVSFHNFLSRADLVLTDSGGVQEEAAALHVPALVLRDVTERAEGLTAGALRLAGTGEEQVYAETLRLLSDERALAGMRRAPNPFGDGHASRRIAEAIERWAEGRKP